MTPSDILAAPQVGSTPFVSRREKSAAEWTAGDAQFPFEVAWRPVSFVGEVKRLSREFMSPVSFLFRKVYFLETLNLQYTIRGVPSNLFQRLAGSRWMWFLKGLPVLPRAAAMFRAKRYTMTTPVRCRSLWDSCKSVLEGNVPGCFVECGVWKGGSSAIMALAIKNARQKRHLHLFDSFEGLPEPTEMDGERAAAYSGGRKEGKLVTVNQCRAGLDEVRHLILDKIKVREEFAHFHVGWFQNTIPVDARQLGPIALLRLDGDWYDSTKICLEQLYPLLSPGGIIILDDYHCWEGCQKATDEYRQKNGITAPIVRADEECCYWINP